MVEMLGDKNESLGFPHILTSSVWPEDWKRPAPVPIKTQLAFKRGLSIPFKRQLCLRTKHRCHHGLMITIQLLFTIVDSS